MKDLIVECSGCGNSVFNHALFVFGGKFQEAFCGGDCLFKYLEKKKNGLVEEKKKSVIYDEVKKVKAKTKEALKRKET